MGRKQLQREIERENLIRLEDAARTEEDFNAVIVLWDKRDESRERNERRHEMQRLPGTLEVGYKDGLIFPIPIIHPAWREARKGEFLALIYENANEVWQLIEDWDIASLVKNLSNKQREVLFLTAVRLCTAARIAYCHDKTDRSVRKLLAAALDSIRDKLAPLIREQIATGFPQTTPAKRVFLARYDTEKAAALDSGDSG